MNFFKTKDIEIGPLKLFKVLRKYKYYTIYEMVWAENKVEVYKYLDWKKEDKPKLIIIEISCKPGCFLSLSVNRME